MSVRIRFANVAAVTSCRDVIILTSLHVRPTWHASSRVTGAPRPVGRHSVPFGN